MRSRPALVLAAAAGLAPASPALADTVRVLTLATNRIAYCPTDGRIYATIPSSAGATGNSVTPIDPVAGTVGASVFVGSEPLQIVFTSSGQSAYVGLSGAGAVRIFDTATQAAGAQFAVDGTGAGTLYVDDFKPLPGSETVLAIARRNVGFSPRHEGVAVYDAGVMRPTTTPSHTGSNVIAWSPTPGELLGYNNETTEYGLRRMSVTASGASTVQTQQGLISGFSVDIKQAGAFLYTTTGRKIDAATFAFLGTFPFGGSGIIEPDAANGRMWFLTGSGTTRLLRAFDLQTFLEVGAVAITGVGSTATATDLTRWGADGLAFRLSTGQVYLVNTAFVDGSAPGACCFGDGTCTAITATACLAGAGVWRGPNVACGAGACPQPGACCMADGTCSFVTQASCAGTWTSAGTTCAAANCPPPAGPTIVRIVPLMTSRIAYNPVDGKVYAAIPGNAGAPVGNSVTPITAATAAVGPSVFMGSDPTQIAISDSGRYVYTGLAGSGRVRRLDTTTQTAGLQYELPYGFSSHDYVDDLKVMPGSENTVAISRRNQGFSPRHEGVVIYDGDVPRPTTTSNFSSTNVIAFGGSPSVLYGFNNESTGYDLRRLTIDASGVTIAQSNGSLVSGFNTDIKYAGGFIYSTNGRKVDATSFTIAGTFPATASGPVEPDPARGRVYYIATTGSPRVLRAFDINTFLDAGSVNISGISSSAGVTDLFRWGTNGLVFRTTTGQVVFVNTALVPPPPVCYANCDASTTVPALNVLDFTCFLQKFAGGDLYANCDASTAAPVLNVLDFTCFLQKFAAGCP